MNASKSKYSTIRWILLSQLLLVIYLGFFHFAIDRSPSEILIAGLVCSSITTAIVFVCRNFFLNRFEYIAHYVIGLDIFFEGFVKHEGLGFYYCAASFWTVFYCYHGYLLYTRKPVDIESELAREPQAESLG